jgi:transposase-like protein
MARISSSQLGFGDLFDGEADQSSTATRLFPEGEFKLHSGEKKSRKTVVIDPEELRRMYLDEQMSQADIAAVFGCHAMTVNKRMKELEIPARDRAWKQSKPVTEEWLRQKYLVEELDCPEIAKIVERNGRRVFDWLREFGIPTRPRGYRFKKQLEDGTRVLPSFKGHHHSEERKAKLREDRLRDGGVPYLKDGVHHLKGKRGSETPSWKGGVTPERQAFYSSDEWKLAARTVWARDDAKCRRCGKDHRSVPYRQRGNFAIHHIISFAYRPLRAEPSNLVLLCRPCHLWVHSSKNVNKEFINEFQKGTLPSWLKPSSDKLRALIGNFGTETQLKS